MGEEVRIVWSSRSNHLHSRKHRRLLVQSLWTLTKQWSQLTPPQIQYKMSVPLTTKGDISSYLDKLFPRLLKVPGVSFRFSCMKTKINVPTWLFICTKRYKGLNWVLISLFWYVGINPNFPLITVYPKMPDVCSHPHVLLHIPIKEYWRHYTLLYEVNIGSAKIWSSLDMHTYTALTLLSPYVIKVSAWVVIGFRLQLLSRSIDRPSVQQLFLSSWHDAFGCQLFSPLGFATKFFGIRLLIGKHTWRKCKRQDLLITQRTRSKNRNWHQAFRCVHPIWIMVIYTSSDPRTLFTQQSPELLYFVFTFPWRKYWERKDEIITGQGTNSH